MAGDSGKIKWVIFTQEMPGKVPVVLVDALLTKIAERGDMEVAAVCLRRSSESGHKPRYRKGWRHFFKHLFGRRQAEDALASVLQRHRVSVIHPPENNVNHPDLLHQWRESGVTYGFSIYCLQKFSPDLLACFRTVANYHNGLLPFYKGVRATSWSIYQGEKESGYTFHLMTPELDAGPILLQGSIPITPADGAIALDLQKATLAAQNIGQVIQQMATNHPGQPQTGSGSYYSSRHLASIENIGPPGTLTAQEIQTRLRAFGKLFVTLDGKTIPFRKLRPVQEKTDRPCILTSDGAWLEIVK